MLSHTDSADYKDLDDYDVFSRFDEAIERPETLNIIVEFDEKKAYAALDQGALSIAQFLQYEIPKGTKARWISIWGPERQKDRIQAIADRYGFSPRLLGIMCTDHSSPLHVDDGLHGTDHLKRRSDHKLRASKRQKSQPQDPEKDGQGRHSTSSASALDLSHYHIIDEVWHYSTVDWGSSYLCVGFNSITSITVEEGQDHWVANDDFSGYTAGNGDPPTSRHHRDKPRGARVWSWLVLCDDDTVISIYENPLPGHRGPLSTEQARSLRHIRRNMRNVFKQLSIVNDTWRKNNPINTLNIRPSSQGNVTISESPSLLFYYLFDDWYTTYALVARKEQQYAAELERIRDNMFERPDVELIQRLHQSGRQLAVLKRIYQSYELIVSRILERQRPVVCEENMCKESSDQTFHVHSNNNSAICSSNESPAPRSEIAIGHQTLGVPLSAAATVKFERLKDRIRLYALSEIQECLDERDALVFLNFNLITLKESQAVEKLTRITILLAKVTILFMPVSLMTGYFSTQIQDLQGIYTAKTYWICFAVITALSFLVLVFFGYYSGTVEGKPVYKSLTQTAINASKIAWKTRRKRKSK